MKCHFRRPMLMALLCCSSVFAADKIKIGFISSLSGSGGALGVDIRDGFQLALTNNSNKLGGLPVELSGLDDQMNPDIGRQASERLIKRDHVDVMTGMVFSNELLPLLPAILESDTVYIASNTGPAVYAVYKCNENFFVISWQNEDVPGAMGKYVMQQNEQNVFLIGANYPGGRDSIPGFKRPYPA